MLAWPDDQPSNHSGARPDDQLPVTLKAHHYTNQNRVKDVLNINIVDSFILNFNLVKFKMTLTDDSSFHNPFVTGKPELLGHRRETTGTSLTEQRTLLLVTCIISIFIMILVSICNITNHTKPMSHA